MSRELDRIHDELIAAPDGAEKIALAKRGYMLADRENEISYSLRFRFEYIKENAFFGDRLQIYLAFPEALRLYDSYVKHNPHTKYTIDILWDYKWLIQCAVNYYQISSRQFDAFSADYERRLTQAGYSLRSLNLYKAIFYMKKDPEEAERYYTKYLQYKRDMYSDCEACERCDEMRYLIGAGRLDDALEVGDDIFSRRLTCEEQPYEASAEVLREYCNIMLSGDFSVAEKAPEHIENVKKGLKKGVITHRAPYVILYYALTGETSKALPFFKKYGVIINDNHEPEARFEFDIAAARLFKSIGKSNYRLKLAADHPVYKESGVYDCEEISSYYCEDAAVIAQKFDKRDGTDAHMKRAEFVTARL